MRRDARRPANVVGRVQQGSTATGGERKGKRQRTHRQGRERSKEGRKWRVGGSRL